MSLFGTIGSNISQAYNTGSQLLGLGYKAFAETKIGGAVDSVASPVFGWVNRQIPESCKNKSFVYGIGATMGLRVTLHWKNNTMNNHLE